MDSTAQQSQGGAAASQQSNQGTTTNRPATVAPDRMLQFFEYAHLPAHLQDVSRMFHDVAHQIAANIPQNPERTVALRKLLETKDCAVRAVLYQP